MSKIKKDFFSGIFFLAFAVFLYAMSFKINVGTMDSLGGQFFPQVVSICMGLLALSQIISCLRKGLSTGEVGKTLSKTDKMYLFANIAILVLYVALIEILGFVIVSILYLLAQMWILTSEEKRKDKKRVIVIVVTSVVSPILIYLLFYYAFNIFLPAGILG